MKITIRRVDLITKMKAARAKLRKSAEVFNDGIMERFMDGRKQDIDKISDLLEKLDKFKPLKLGRYRDNDFQIDLHNPEAKRVANTSYLDYGISVLESCQDDILVIDTARDKYGLYEAIRQALS